MKRLYYCLLFAAVTIAKGASASSDNLVYQTAELKNGSVLYGYIQENDGYGNLTFHSDSAVVLLENVVADVVDRTVGLNQLSAQWQKWAAENDALSGTPGNQYMLISDVSVRSVSVTNNNFLNKMKSRHIANVRLLERGVRYKYVEMNANSYKLNWSDIASITSERRPKTALSGVNWICQLKNGLTYEGQYAGETEKTTSLYLADGVKQTMNKDDVVKYTFRTINPNQTIFEQSQLLDRVNTKNAGFITGIIIEQNYTSKKDEENYILVQQESGAIQSFKLSDVLSVSNEGNPRYAPEYDIILQTGEVYINGQEAKSELVTVKKGVYTLNNTNPFVVKRGTDNLTTVTVQYNASAFGTNVEAFRVIPISHERKGKKDTYTFDDETLANTVYRPVSIGTTVNQTTKAVYQLNGAGYFGLYDGRTKQIYVVYVQ
jgi:hypothetical protein